MRFILEEKITTHQFRLSNLRALHFGAGASAKSLPFKHLKYYRFAIEVVLNFILDGENWHSLAQGDQKVTTFIGELVSLISFQRAFDVSRMWKNFEVHQLQ